jgi:hypothetical protein
MSLKKNNKKKEQKSKNIVIDKEPHNNYIRFLHQSEEFLLYLLSKRSQVKGLIHKKKEWLCLTPQFNLYFLKISYIYLNQVITLKDL